MRTSSSCLVWLLYSISSCSFCHCILRLKCQVLEKKYFSEFIDLKFFKCSEFETLDFNIGVNCDMVENLNMSLMEVPLETDWLCLTNYLGSIIQAESFSRFKTLKALYILGSFEIFPGSFMGLPKLSTLWLESVYLSGNITFHEDSFVGLQDLQELKISSVKFSTLNPLIFKYLQQVEHLILELNQITSLSTVTKLLAKMKRLQKLSVIANDIEALTESDCLLSEDYSINSQFLDFNISYLDLSMNKLSTVQNNSLCNFPQLSVFKADKMCIDLRGLLQSGIKTTKVLSLAGIYFKSLDICQFVSQFQVKHFLIMFNDLTEITTSKGSCNNLKTLDVSNNDLTQINFKQMKELNNLMELNLCHNKIKIFKICSNKTIHVMELVYLNLSFNILKELEGKQFNCLRNLEVLALDNNQIANINNRAFEDLNQLKVLNLQNNFLYEIYEYTFFSLLSLTHLNLYENNVVTFTKFAFPHFGELQEIKLTFQNLFDRFLWLDYIPTSVNQISVQSKPGFIEVLDEKFNTFSELEKLEVDAERIYIDACSKFAFTHLKELHLNNNLLLTCFEDVEPVLGNFTNLEKLTYTAKYHSSDYIATINSSLRHLKKLTFLHLQDTYQQIESGQINVYELFQGLSHLKVLHLQNSGIKRLDSVKIFSDLKDLEFFVFENENMLDVNENVFSSMSNLKYIYFLKTTFPCNCKFNWLLSWLESGTSVSIINFHEQECYINTETSNLVSFLHKNCHTLLDFKLFLSTFIFTLLFMSLSVCYESVWWYLLYMYYTLRCWLNYRHRARDRYEYDAFVSYNAQNEQWVTAQLLPNLEQNGPPFLKLCIHNRDFEIGRDIVDNIMDSIYNSRWTICLISRSYLQSSWCSLEMRMATYRLVAENKNSLILIFLDKISREELQHYHQLTKLLNKKTFLIWPDDINGQQLFWARLHKVIQEENAN